MNTKPSTVNWRDISKETREVLTKILNREMPHYNQKKVKELVSIITPIFMEVLRDNSGEIIKKPWSLTTCIHLIAGEKVCRCKMMSSVYCHYENWYRTTSQNKTRGCENYEPAAWYLGRIIKKADRMGCGKEIQQWAESLR